MYRPYSQKTNNHWPLVLKNIHVKYNGSFIDNNLLITTEVNLNLSIKLKNEQNLWTSTIEEHLVKMFKNIKYYTILKI